VTSNLERATSVGSRFAQHAQIHQLTAKLKRDMLLGVPKPPKKSAKGFGAAPRPRLLHVPQRFSSIRRIAVKITTWPREELRY
jgi:hypothetical protein